jgi:hypothetical protein
MGVQALFLLAFIGQLVAFRQHGNRWLLGSSLLTSLLLFAGYYVVPSGLLLQLSLFGLAACSVWLIIAQCRSANCETSRRS